MNQFDTSKKYAPVQLGDVLVLGLGKSGKAASSYCARLIGSRVSSLTIAAGADNEAARAFAAQMQQAGAAVAFETYDISALVAQRGGKPFDMCVASPGISQFSDFYQSALANSAEVISEVEFAWRESAASSKWVAITGTNGKTTTTSLMAHVLQCCGFPAAAVGNIGDTCLEAVEKGTVGYYVAEVSSYQLASTRYFAPDAVILLNITPDHIKWHGSFQEYCNAKFKVFANVAPGGTSLIMDATNDIVREGYKILRDQHREGLRLIPVGTASGLYESMTERCGAANCAYLGADGTLTVHYEHLQSSGRVPGALVVTDMDDVTVTFCRASELQIPGEHNASNALHVAAAALELGADLDGIEAALKSFAPLEHRIEPCGTIAGVRCYNDSKATNVDATLKALEAFAPEKPIVLLGGDDKGTDLAELVASAEKHCKAVVCFGEGGPRFLAAFEGASIPAYSAPHMAEALEEALAHAQAGDIVVLSPACASFDEFNSFEHRGQVFKQLVAKHASERGA